MLDTHEKFNAWEEGIDSWNQWVIDHPEEELEEVANRFKLFLRGAAVINLWRRGVRDWNDWVARNPKAHVDFRKQRLKPNEKNQAGDPIFDFRGFIFPEGETNFFGADFSSGMVNFLSADFRNANVNFGSVDFGDQEAVFTSSAFGDGRVYFAEANFGSGGATFDYAIFGGCKVDFSFAKFLGPARFLGLRDLEACRRFSFEGARFESLLNFSVARSSAGKIRKMGCPVDLRRTKLAHDMVVNDIVCDYIVDASSSRSSLPPVASDREDSQRFRRLKELAVANRNHGKALEFHVQEIRFRRGHDTKLWREDLAQLLYWLSSDYGRSVKAPIGWLFFLWVSFGGLFWLARTEYAEFSDKALKAIEGLTRDGGTALGYSGSNMLAFVPTGGTARQQGIELLFGGRVPDWVLLLSGAQSILAVILLFLLGLGLRNLFRV